MKASLLFVDYTCNTSKKSGKRTHLFCPQKVDVMCKLKRNKHWSDAWSTKKTFFRWFIYLHSGLQEQWTEVFMWVHFYGNIHRHKLLLNPTTWEARLGKKKGMGLGSPIFSSKNCRLLCSDCDTMLKLFHVQNSISNIQRSNAKQVSKERETMTSWIKTCWNSLQ